jgi:hypothetical protein
MKRAAVLFGMMVLCACAPQTPPEAASTPEDPGAVTSGTVEQPVVGAEAAAAYQAAIAPLAPVIPDMFGAMRSVN